MRGSPSSIHRKTWLFTRLCAAAAVIYFVIRMVNAGGVHPTLLIPVSYMAAVAFLSGLLRKRGWTPLKAALIPNAPLATLMLAAMVFGDTNAAVQRQLLPDWLVAAIFLTIGLIVSTIMVWRDPRRNDPLA